MKEQLLVLEQAEIKINKQIDDWNTKKSKQLNELLHCHSQMSQIENIRDRIEKINNNMREATNHILNNKKELKEFEENNKYRAEQLLMQIEAAKQEYSKANNTDKTRIIPLQTTLLKLKEQVLNYEKKIQVITNQLEDARKSYYFAKEAELNAIKLQQAKIVVPTEILTDQSNKYKLKNEPTINLPLEEESAKDQYPIKVKLNPVLTSSKGLDSLGNIGSPRTRCSSTRRSCKTNIAISGTAKDKENEENIRDRQQKYTEKDKRSRHKGRSSESFYLSKKETHTLLNKRPLPNDLRISFEKQSATSQYQANKAKQKIVEQLAKGIDLYKKFAVKYNNKLPIFNPSNAKLCPPVNCGYGLKHFSINTKHNAILIEGDIEIPIQSIKSIIIEPNVKNILLKSMKDVYLPFSIELERNRKIELIATKCDDLKLWIKGIELLAQKRLVIL